jgi:hypothetical protein
MFFREHGSGGDIDQPISIGIMPSIDISVGGRTGIAVSEPGSTDGPLMFQSTA